MKCIHCRKEFTPRSHWNISCSRLCIARTWRYRSSQAFSLVYFPTCQVCNSIFTCQDRKGKFCGKACKDRNDKLKYAHIIYARQLAKQRANPAAVNAYRVAYRAKNPEHWRRIYVIKESRRRARLANCRHNSFTIEEFMAICIRQTGKCWWCGMSEKLTIDHILPIAKGGSHIFWNIVAACKSCNSAKRDRIWPLSAGVLWA